MKVGIITLYGNDNYGNKLQNLALQNQLEKLNIDVQTIRSQDLRVSTLIKRKIKNILKKEEKPLEKKEREKFFIEFNNNIKYSNEIINMYKPKIKEIYDYYIYGSDQIWNCEFEGKSDLFLGLFSNKNRNISFAASFGIEEVYEKYKKKYIKALNNFKAISVREEKGREIIKNLIDVEVPVLLDPTMLLDKEEWKKYEKKPKNLNENTKYILNYFLGSISDEADKEIKRIAKEQKCEIINILDKKSPFYKSGPSEFLYLESHAYLICTDSFHSCVFAILEDRPFCVFGRKDQHKSMNSRIDTLLNKFNMQNRYFNTKISNDILVSNYEEAKEIINIEKKKSIKYIKEALEIK